VKFDPTNCISLSLPPDHCGSDETEPFMGNNIWPFTGKKVRFLPKNFDSSTEIYSTVYEYRTISHSSKTQILNGLLELFKITVKQY
jgi:hypothetical protein